MSELAFAQDALQRRIAPIGSAQSVEQRIRLAARRLGWKFSRASSVWYADDRVSLKPRELRKIQQITGLEYGRQELRSNAELIARADALLMGSDPDFHRAFVAALRAVIGASDRS